jgi:hypothetical protein
MKYNNDNLISNEGGFSLLLVILILSAMLITTLIISDIVLEVGRSLTKVPHSEVALYAAEAGIEQALYAINKEYAEVDMYAVSASDGEEDLMIDGAKYEIENGGDINNEANDIFLIRRNIDGTLEPGESLVLEYDLNFSEDLYYETLYIRSTETDSLLVSAVAISPDTGEISELPSVAFEGGSLSVDEGLFKIRLYNDGDVDAVYDIRQGAGSCEDDGSDISACPIVGVRIKSHGRYKSTERIVEVEDWKWHKF